MKKSEYLKINKKLWNDKTDVHIDSKFYDHQSFLEGRSSLNPFELDLLKDIKGKEILHLQCHFGQDSISLARMGAKVTGIDLSDKAIEKAKEFNDLCGTDCDFICSPVYELPDVLEKKFDLVFTSYGVISWMPDIERWAGTVDHFLKPGGRFVFVEFHPAVWMYDDDFTRIEFHYFNREAIIESEVGTYADRESMAQNKYVCWNHGLGEVTQSLINHGLSIESFQEYDYAPYQFVNGMEEFEKGKFRIKKFKDKMPLVYSLLAHKK